MKYWLPLGNRLVIGELDMALRFKAMVSRFTEYLRRKPLPAPLRNLYLMLRWQCLIHLFADIQYPFSCRIARGARIGKCKVICRGRREDAVVLGRVYLHDGVVLDALGGFLHIGDGTTVNPYCVFYGTGGLVIGAQCGIATHTVIVAANHTFVGHDSPMMSQPVSMRGITIADDVWLGAGARVLDGVTLEKGIVVGAGAVVTRSFPSGAVIAGVPAKLLKMREGFGNRGQNG